MLNAFRRRRFHHRLALGPVVSVATGAQRLPASKVPSRNSITCVSVNPKCSTPSGVEGSITLAGWRCGDRGHESAQRLPASKVPSHLSLEAMRAVVDLCSTPSGVEGSITAHARAYTRAILVLNAFRRRRFHHRQYERARRERPAVLNAFRRRRFHHKCARGDYQRDLIVLNAFRRRRFHHNNPGTNPADSCLCSTPSGVEGSITSPTSRSASRGPSAQRLPASKVPSRAPGIDDQGRV